MKYLVVEKDRSKLVDGKYLRNWIKQTKGEIRIFRICGTNDPVEMFMRFFGNEYFIVDRFGNNEGV